MAQGIKHLNREALYWLEKNDPEAYEEETTLSRAERKSARRRADAKAAAKARKKANRTRDQL